MLFSSKGNARYSLCCVGILFGYHEPRSEFVSEQSLGSLKMHKTSGFEFVLWEISYPVGATLFVGNHEPVAFMELGFAGGWDTSRSLCGLSEIV